MEKPTPQIEQQQQQQATVRMDTEKLLKQMQAEEKQKQEKELAKNFANDMNKQNNDDEEQNVKTTKPIGKTIIQKQSKSNGDDNLKSNSVGNSDSTLFYTLSISTFLVVLAFVVVLISWLLNPKKNHHKYQLPTHNTIGRNGIVSNGGVFKSLFDDDTKRD